MLEYRKELAWHTVGARILSSLHRAQCSPASHNPELTIAGEGESGEGSVGRSAQAGVKGGSLGAGLPEFTSRLCSLPGLL